MGKKKIETKEKKVPAKAIAVKKTTVKKVKTVKLDEALSGEDFARVVAQGMYEKKASNIRILDMRGIKGASADYFVISHGTSDKQVEAIADSAEEEVRKKTGEKPWHREGYQNLEWILLDYFDVVAHIFQEEKREFYGVEELWGDAAEVEFKGH
jgi:ribosome-associated protein